MILKYFELEKLNFDITNFLLFHGKNEGYKGEEIKKITNKFKIKVKNYDEKQIIDNTEEFFANNLNKSLFDSDKIIIINRCTDKIIKIVEELIDRNINDIIFILNSEVLEKKSKLRNFFEKSKKLVIIPTYKDDYQSLLRIARDFFLKKKINISQETINLLVSRCNGDRGYLKLELSKISNYLIGRKNISLKEIYTLTNLSENYTATELVDSSLGKNYEKTCRILNESYYSQEDTFLILRIFLQKSKRILSMLETINNGKNIDIAIQEHKPPIFWKDKPIIKHQIQLWRYDNVQLIISKINSLEIMIKKNNSLGMILLKDFIYDVINIKPNNSF